MWTDEQLSEVFWHHHRRFLHATLAGVAVGIIGTTLLLTGYYELAACAALVQLAVGWVMLWHRARASLLTKLRFPPGRG